MLSICVYIVSILLVLLFFNEGMNLQRYVLFFNKNNLIIIDTNLEKISIFVYLF